MSPLYHPVMGHGYVIIMSSCNGHGYVIMPSCYGTLLCHLVDMVMPSLCHHVYTKPYYDNLLHVTCISYSSINVTIVVMYYGNYVTMPITIFLTNQLAFYLNDKCQYCTDNVSTLFRASTLPTMLMDQFMKLTAITYLHSILKDPIQQIMQSQDVCEVSVQTVQGCPVVIWCVLNTKDMLCYKDIFWYMSAWCVVWWVVSLFNNYLAHTFILHLCTHLHPPSLHTSSIQVLFPRGQI